LKFILACLIAVAVTTGSPAAYAVQPDEIMADPARESRARELSRELRCMVARTSRSTIPMRRWRATCAFWCASGSRPATATRR
jgi:hypothetical protein